jgi:hypothetical protein
MDISMLGGVSTVYLNLIYLNDIYIQALQVCEHYQRHEEMVYLLGNHQCVGCSIPIMCMYVHVRTSPLQVGWVIKREH